MFAISTIIRQPNGAYDYYDGILVKLPVELHNPARMREHLAIERPGWGVGTFGYQHYARQGSGGEWYIFPGLMVHGGPRITKKFHGYKSTLEKSQVEQIAEGICKFADSMRAVAQEDFNLLIHDLRSISNSLYNAAEEARRFASMQDMVNVQVRIENIIASQTILRIRTDALDFVGNAAPLLKDEEIPVFRRVDKVNRSFKARAWDQGKNLHLSGQSIGCTYGPEIIEIVPYTLIDNALKYASHGSDIEVHVEDRDEFIVVSVKSPGPKIEPSEYESIFTRGVRGKAAVASGVPGSGLGLHIVAKIVQQHFGGSVAVQQRDHILTYEGIDLYETEFTVQFPRHQPQKEAPLARPSRRWF